MVLQRMLIAFYPFCIFFCELLLEFISTIGICLTKKKMYNIYYFTPCHFIISDFISEIIKFYIRYIRGKIIGIKEENQLGGLNKEIVVIFFSIIVSINLICSLIFNEIIIINLCDLQFYTKKHIKERKLTDSSLLVQDNYLENESYTSSENFD